MTNQAKFFRKKRMAEINVVPYIDVMLVLLVIFMVTAPFLMEGYRVQLPEAKARAVDKSSAQPLVVAVDTKGRLYLNSGANANIPIDADTLIARVRAKRKQDPTVPVLIKGDTHADYGMVINAMSILMRAGIDDFSLVTKPGNIR
jgi:biopolymer transport protein TolR